MCVSCEPPHVNNNSNIDINSLDVIHPDLSRLDTGQINMPTCVINKLLLDWVRGPTLPNCGGGHSPSWVTINTVCALSGDRKYSAYLCAIADHCYHRIFLINDSWMSKIADEKEFGSFWNVLSIVRNINHLHHLQLISIYHVTYPYGIPPAILFCTMVISRVGW